MELQEEMLNIFDDVPQWMIQLVEVGVFINENGGQFDLVDGVHWDVLDADQDPDEGYLTQDDEGEGNVSFNVLLGGLPEEDSSGERVSVNTSFDTESDNNNIEWVNELNVKNH